MDAFDLLTNRGWFRNRWRDWTKT